jgi:hypothetical protein
VHLSRLQRRASLARQVAGKVVVENGVVQKSVSGGCRHGGVLTDMGRIGFTLASVLSIQRFAQAHPLSLC